MPDLISGTVTFLFSDIEGSTQLLHQLGAEYATVLAEHQQLLRVAFETHNGQEMSTQGDSFAVVFARAGDAVAAAVAAQRALHEHSWPPHHPVRVRMGLHTGEPTRTGDDYVGIDLHHVARLMSAGHGGQVLLSHTTYELVKNQLPDGVKLHDLGVHQLKDIEGDAQIYQLVIAGLPANFPPLRTRSVHLNNLPVQPTPLIGRENEIAQVKRLLNTTRLLTLTGPGGLGKTRLALQAATEVEGTFKYGVCLVELAALNDPELVPQAVAEILGVREEPNRPVLRTVSEFLKEHSLLLVLDNCEHLLHACSQLAVQCLRAAPHLKILATSRENLSVAGEVTWRVPPLSQPDPALFTPGREDLVEMLSQYEAVQLFIARATAIAQSFRVTNDNAPAVAEICHRLDGIPLAIELAAARVKVLSVEQIAARLNDRFRF
jgi:class 3 adenylate cyclase